MKTVYWPGVRTACTTNAFTRGSSDQLIDWSSLQRSENQRRASSANVARARANGTDRSTMHGISKKADTRIAAHARKAGR